MNNIQNELIDFQVLSQEAFQHYLNEFKNRCKIQNYINLFVVINKFWSEIAEKKVRTLYGKDGQILVTIDMLDIDIPENRNPRKKR